MEMNFTVIIPMFMLYISTYVYPSCFTSHVALVIYQILNSNMIYKPIIITITWLMAWVWIQKVQFDNIVNICGQVLFN